MKLSKREKMLIVILLIVVVAFLLYKYVYLRNKANLEELSLKYEEKNKQYEEMINRIKQKNYFASVYKELNFEINEITTQFLPKLEQEKIIVFINKYLENNNIEASAITFTDVELDTFSKEAVEGEEDNSYLLQEIKSKLSNESDNKSSEEKNVLDVESATCEIVTLNIVYSSEYVDLLDFIDEIQNNSINVTITNMTVVRNTDNTVQGTMTMNYYSVPKLHDHENLEWVWNDLIEYGRSNPFYDDGSNRATAWTTRFDFALNIKPISSDLPTVTIAKTNDSLRKTYVYADSNSIENVDVYFKEENGTFYYKYQTRTDIYPNDGSWDSFIPENDFISFKIYSTKRNSDEDISGVKINIVNETDYMIYASIIEEDIIRPRVYFEDSSKVIISRD